MMLVPLWYQLDYCGQRLQTRNNKCTSSLDNRNNLIKHNYCWNMLSYLMSTRYLHSRNGIRSSSAVSSGSSLYGFIGTQFSGWRLDSNAWPLTYKILAGSLFNLERSCQPEHVNSIVHYTEVVGLNMAFRTIAPKEIGVWKNPHKSRSCISEGEMIWRK